jgi:PAS domain S-box-containing protein
MSQSHKAFPDNQAAGKDLRRTSLRSTLFLRFGLLGVGAVLLFTLAYILFGLFPLVNQIAASHFDTTIETANGLIRESLLSAENVVRIASGWSGPQGFAADQPEEFNDLFSPVLQKIPQATSIVAGTTDGLGWMLLQLPDGSWHNRFTNIPARGNEQLYYNWQDDHLLQRYYKRVDYDPRQRLWFKIAMAAPADGRAHWTAPYTFFTTGDPGITVSTRRDLPNNLSLVVGIDLKLKDISSISADLSVGKRGYVLVLTDEGNLLGLPRSTVLPPGSGSRDVILKPAEELGLEPVNAALGLWRDHKNAYLKPEVIKAQGQRWLFVMHPLQLGEQTFWIAAFAPVTEFLPPIYNVGNAIAASLALVLALTFLAARRQARLISLPLEALATSSSKIARLDFSESPRITTRWHEINSLVMAQSNMLEMLRHSQDTVNEQADKLRSQVNVLRATQDQLQRTLNQEQVILDNALTGILFVKDRSILRSNHRASEIFGYENVQEMVGKSTATLYESYADFLAIGEQAYGAFGRGESYGKEMLLKRRDGSTFWGYVQGRALDNADPTGGGAVWVVSDLSERQEMDRMKDEMLSVVGHEVRTPLAGIMGYAELMMDVDIPLEQRREFLGIIYNESERLAELFDNFLNLQTIKKEKSSLNYQPVDLKAVLGEAVDLFKGASKKHQLLFDCQDDLPAIQGEAAQLHRVFLNLISNAIKYSPDGGPVAVSARRSNDAVIVRVEDQGIGISSEASERVFESFFRVDNRDNRSIGGTGLGLALVKETVKKHGGRVWVESRVGKGSTFFVSLPVPDIPGDSTPAS